MGVQVPSNPINRQEQYLAKIAGQAVEIPAEPITREEAYLDYIAKHGGGGGGGTNDYDDLLNQPKINDVTLKGNKSAEDLGLADKTTVDNILNGTDIDSFGDVETALSGKQNALTAGEYISISAQNEIKVNRTPSNDVLTYKITTPEHPKVNIQKYENGELVSETLYQWNGTTQTWTIDDKFTLKAWRDAAWGASSWQVTLLVDSYEHDAGWQKTWGSQDGTHFDMDFDKVDVSALKLVIKSEMDTALAGKQDTLTFDNTPTEDSNNPVKSGGIYDALAGKADLTDLAPAFSAETAYTVGQYVSYDGNIYKCTSAHSAGAWAAGDFTLVAVGSELESKQNTLTFDDTPTQNSTNPVKSGGVYSALAGKTPTVNNEQLIFN